ncbi:MAG: hypothetical protein GX892_13995 [Thermoanaerobacteraceae bacterium]|nr:hypothetical protein [Thermoanaerobacteraceae bacterium]
MGYTYRYIITGKGSVMRKIITTNFGKEIAYAFVQIISSRDTVIYVIED